MVVKTENPNLSEIIVPNPAVSTVSLKEVRDSGVRFEASAFDAEAREAIQNIKDYKDGYDLLLSESGVATWCSTPIRMKRIYVSEAAGIPLFSSSDIINIENRPSAHISRTQTKKIDDLKIEKFDVMVSRSGTIGNVGFAGSHFEDACLTEDALRIRSSNKTDAGFVAAFLRSKFGRLQLTRSIYGSVVQHIEPDHLAELIIPRLHPIKRSEIGQMFVDALDLRDEALEKLSEARSALLEAIPIKDVRTSSGDVSVATTQLSKLHQRFEASYHSQEATYLDEQLVNPSGEFLAMSSPELEIHVKAVTKFRKRVYVKGPGIPLLSSKSIFQIDPIEVKRLGKGVHAKDLPEIGLKPGMVLVTCSGTIGRILSVCEYMDGWAVNQHAIRIYSKISEINSLVYTWLSTEIGNLLVTRNAYGSVILEVDRWMVGDIKIPRPSSVPLQDIHELVSTANEARSVAWNLEQKAIAMIESLIVG